MVKNYVAFKLLAINTVTLEVLFVLSQLLDFDSVVMISEVARS